MVKLSFQNLNDFALAHLGVLIGYCGSNVFICEPWHRFDPFKHLHILDSAYKFAILSLISELLQSIQKDLLDRYW